MKIKAIVSTAKGSAGELEGYLKSPIFKYMMGLSGKGVSKFELYTNDDDKVILEVECNVRKFFKITKNLNRFDSTFKLVMSKVRKNKLVKKRYDLTEEKQAMLDKLMEEHTHIDIIKEATAEELIEGNKTFWQRMKDKFRRVE